MSGKKKPPRPAPKVPTPPREPQPPKAEKPAAQPMTQDGINRANHEFIESLPQVKPAVPPILTTGGPAKPSGKPRRCWRSCTSTAG
jgi:hypothetical protein